MKGQFNVGEESYELISLQNDMGRNLVLAGFRSFAMCVKLIRG